MPKVGDIVFAKTKNAYEDEPVIRPGIVTRVFTADDGEWAKDREIIGVTLFGHGGSVEYLDMDKGTLDDEGKWAEGGWATTADGPSDAAPAPTVVDATTGNETSTQDNSAVVSQSDTVTGQG